MISFAGSVCYIASNCIRVEGQASKRVCLHFDVQGLLWVLCSKYPEETVILVSQPAFCDEWSK